MVHPEDRIDELGLHLGPGLGVQVGDLDEVIVIQDLLGDPQGLRVQAHRGDAAALAVAPVVHLDGGGTMWRPATGTLAAKPVTPQPPSSAAFWMRPAG